MATEANITLPEELLARAQRASAADGESVDQLIEKAIDQYLYRRDFENFNLGAEAGKMTDEEAIDFATRLVHDFRREHPEFYER
jgi:metal-responsive CopG/Arc/MetJ family transcriptional regulator